MNVLPPPIYGGLSVKEQIAVKNIKPLEKKEKDLTVKQRKWLKEYIKSGNATQAVIDAGYDVSSRGSASVIASENLAKLNFIDFLELMGISDHILATKLNEGIDATKEISAVILIDKNGNIITRENEGQIQVADYPTRLKYVEAILKLKGRFKNAEVQVNQLNVQQNDNRQMPVPILGGISDNKERIRTMDTDRLAQEIAYLTEALDEKMKLEEFMDTSEPESIEEPQEAVIVPEIETQIIPDNIKELEVTMNPEPPQVILKETKPVYVPEIKPQLPKDARQTIDERKQKAMQTFVTSPDNDIEPYQKEDDLAKKNWTVI